MRQLQVLVDDSREAVADIFDEDDLDYVRQEAWTDGDRQWLFSALFPTTRLATCSDSSRRQASIPTSTRCREPRKRDDTRRQAAQNPVCRGFRPATQSELLSKPTDMSQDPTSFCSVLFLSSVIAAALIPAAATSGLAIVWGEPRVAFGSLLLLVVTMILVNLGAFGVLFVMGYRPEKSGWLFGTASRRQQIIVVSTAVALLLVVGIVGTGTAAQIAFDREITDAVNALTTQPEYRSFNPVTIRTEYTGELLFPQPETVTVQFAYSGSGQSPDVVDPLEARIQNATGGQVTVRTVYTEYNSSAVVTPNATNTTPS